MLQFLEQRIVSNWSSYFPDRRPPRELQPLVLCASPYRSVMMYFEKGSSAPFLKVKVGSPAKYICREHETLMRLYQVVSPDIRATMPRPLDVVEFNGRMAAFEECLSGTSLFVKYNRNGHVASAMLDYADGALNWLADFARDTRTPDSPLPVCLREVADSGVWKTRGAAGVVDFVQDVCGRLAQLNGRFAMAATHGDFWLGNLLYNGRTLTGVVDWEYAQTGGESTSDLFQFLLTFANYLDRMEPDRTRLRRNPSWGRLPVEWLHIVPDAYGSTLVKAMRFVFFDDNWFAHFAKARTVRHLQALATDPSLAVDLFSLYLARQASLFYTLAQDNSMLSRHLYYKDFLHLLTLWQAFSHESWIATLP